MKDLNKLDVELVRELFDLQDQVMPRVRDARKTDSRMADQLDLEMRAALYSAHRAMVELQDFYAPNLGDDVDSMRATAKKVCAAAAAEFNDTADAIEMRYQRVISDTLHLERCLKAVES